MMKIPFSIKLVLGALLLALAIPVLLLVIQPEKDDLTVSHQEETTQGPNGDAMYLFPIETLEQYIRMADNIVYGQMTDVAPYEPGFSEYTFTITRELKGSAESDRIHVFKENNAMEPGVDYLLFLEDYRGGFTPHPLYKVIGEGGLIRMEADRVKHQNILLAEDVKPQQLLMDIEASPALSFDRKVIFPESGMIIPDFFEPKELAKRSDLVAVVEPVQILRKTKYQTNVYVKIIRQLQGDIKIGAEETVYLPAGVELGRQYLVFIQNRGGLLVVTSKKGSLFDTSDKEKWDEAMQAVEQYGR